ncbi:hypothetical protein L484_013673 [Morus notabilis]|uniref:Uncharacterized protein n=1 Tax=Morus notabilis TaxID=981085 RepID=W9R8U1_9ROSA|nr:hypothetical protein L484_013673 [Morus notabilis]
MCRIELETRFHDRGWTKVNQRARVKAKVDARQKSNQSQGQLGSTYDPIGAEVAIVPRRTRFSMAPRSDRDRFDARPKLD